MFFVCFECFCGRGVGMDGCSGFMYGSCVCAIYLACNKHQWCSGNINAFQAFALGSIPGWCITFAIFFTFSYFKQIYILPHSLQTTFFHPTFPSLLMHSPHKPNHPLPTSSNQVLAIPLPLIFIQVSLIISYLHLYSSDTAHA